MTPVWPRGSKRSSDTRSTTPVGAPNNEFQSTGILQHHAGGGPHQRTVRADALLRDPGPRPGPVAACFWVGVANSGGPGMLFQGSAGLRHADPDSGTGHAEPGLHWQYGVSEPLRQLTVFRKPLTRPSRLCHSPSGRAATFKPAYPWRITSTSPSFTMYSLPSSRSSPFSRTPG